MSLEHACFLSYRNVPSKPYLKFVADLEELLKGEVAENLGREAVFRDDGQISPGQELDAKLGKEVCRSSCLIMVFIRPYFRDTRDKNLWCCRELLAMTRLQEKRRAMLPPGDAHANGLIIPVIYKDKEACPSSLINNRYYLDFSASEKLALSLSDDKDFVIKVKELGRYVTDQYLALESKGSEICADCPGTRLPSVDDVLSWRSQLDTPAGSFAPPSGALP